MSSLLRPVGHLPASVYWFRRALVLVVLLALVFVLVRVLGGGGSDPKNSAASDPGQSPSTTPTVVPTSAGKTSEPGRTTKSTKTSESPKTTETPKTVKCTGSDVAVEVLPATRSLPAGGAMNLVVQLSAVRDECQAAVDPSELSLTITSGQDQIWTTEHCEKVIPRATLVLAKGKQSPAIIAWDGRRSRPGCLPGQLKAKPGTYVVKAVYDGRASTPQAFTIV